MTVTSRSLQIARVGLLRGLRRMGHRDLGIGLLVGAVITGCAGVLAVSELGSGDYGQWLMAARPYLGESVPAYRDAASVPPVVPFLIGTVAGLVPDRMAAVQVTAVLLLVALAVATYLVGTALFRNRLAGAAAVAASMLFTDAFLDLFAFGGLLQAGATVLLLLGVASFSIARRHAERWWPWLAGSAALGLGAMTHVGTASILVPSVLIAAGVALLAVPPAARMRRIVPVGLVLGSVAVYWLVVLLPGGAELARNPASMTYRGPDRLWDSLVGFWPTWLLGVMALVGIAIGLRADWRRRRIGGWSMVAAWTGVTLAVVLMALATGASTDYPRFATPILAPLAIAAGGSFAIVARAGGTWLRRHTGRGSRREWSLAVVAVLVVAAVPISVTRFHQQVAGYALRDAGALSPVATWIEANVSSDATVLAPVREAKWIEGLTGRATLFSTAIRYSFHPEEWQRSIAAETLLRSAGAIVNPFFFAKLSDADAASDAPRTVTIAANHGGEYVDLLRTVPAQTEVLGADGNALARLSNLAPLEGDRGAAGDGSVTLRWAGERQSGVVTWRQTLMLRPDASTLELVFAAETELPTAGFTAVLRPAGSVEVTDVRGTERAIEVTFAADAPAAPRLRIVVGASGSLAADPDGTIRVSSRGAPVRLLVTDRTASISPDMGRSVLDPRDLIDQFGIEAAVLPDDDLYAVRAQRLAALGFFVMTQIGEYVILERGGSASHRPAGP